MQVLGIVEQEQQSLARQRLCHYVLERAVGLLDHVERARDVPEYQSCVAEGGERHPPDAFAEVIRGLRGRLEGEPRLAGAAGPGQSQKADAVTQLLHDLRQLAVTAEELGRRHREVRHVERPRSREVTLAQLEEPLRRGEILEAMLSERADAEALVEEVPRGLAQEDLAAVGRPHYPRRP